MRKDFADMQKRPFKNHGPVTRLPKTTVKPMSAMASVAEVLPAVAHALGLETKVRELALFTLWGQVLPPLFQNKTQPLRVTQQLAKTTMHVRVQDSLTASELSFHLPGLLKTLNQFSPQTGFMLDRIDLSVGGMGVKSY